MTVCLIDAQGRTWNRIVWERSPNLADTRLFLEAVFWIASTAAPWRDSPAYSENWNTVFKRFRHWVKADVFKRIFDAASDDPGMEYAMIDATNTSDPAGAVCPASRSRLRLDFVRERVARLSLSSRSWRGDGLFAVLWRATWPKRKCPVLKSRRTRASAMSYPFKKIGCAPLPGALIMLGTAPPQRPLTSHAAPNGLDR